MVATDALLMVAQLEEARQRQLDEMPDHLRLLGEILRRSVLDDDLEPLARYLTEQQISIARERLGQFRDYLIISRLDLRDLEPTARARLRVQTLDIENPLLKSADYRRLEASGLVPRCRDCRYFVNPPHDGSPDGDKACTQYGTKGSDIACFGFTSKTDD